MLIQAVSITSPFAIYNLSGNDDLNVALGVTLFSTGSVEFPTSSDAVLAFAGQHRITVAGTILAYDDCINLLGAQGAQYVEIASTAILQSGVASPIADSDCVILDGANSVLINNGSMTARGSAVQVIVVDGGTTTITNNGNMTATSYGIWNRFGAGTLEFTNTGTVESAVQSYLGGNSVDRVTNSGTMKGNVDLGGGDDLYVGIGGTVVGSILGGSGNDRFVIGLSNEVIDGGDGIDTLDLSGLNQKMTVNLATPSLNKGAGVAGDTYTGIENVTGTVYRDAITGDGTANRLAGGGAFDVLIGGGGNDTLIGGAGADTVTGGSGADVFLFETYADRTDVITDFTSGVDVVMINAAAYGFGTATGAIDPNAFCSGTTNAPQDASDRFIYNTTTGTLWFDRDGTGKVATVLLADFADGTVFLASDILLV